MSAPTSNEKRVAIITGAAEGIGRGIALRLAKDGYELGLFDLPRSKDRLEELANTLRSEHKTRVATVFGDVSKEEDVKRLVDTVVQELGSLYAIVANAGVAINRVLHETPTEELDRLLNINVKGVWFSYKYAAIQLIKQGKGGRIIGAASIAGKRGLPQHSAYCATKFAVRGLTQAAALDYGQYGITVNAYAPGTIDTPLLQEIDDYHNKVGGQPKGAWKSTFQNSLGRIGQPSEIAGLVSFLVSDDSSYVTGQTYIADGGIHFD
ncbi:acetoin reductase family protein [Dichomitus squalens]|uniref:Acetoin reductase family protein n=2 Tax=Dichomitus squalens TaxID=114155 RepID=A0A4Q9NE73_9APHY|nr:acetoin reductase family protein [Dichomitus squalens LYAD-421 SS1]EJF56345.1 acetoin reductase family protein [Dichomitus squalens LYAD-421 SS1]TBU22176.1 acetoin reductase family protein [Dichomitus squalens]TBU39360.1 acetoin reductase family protein [Dichomitus squalens]